MHRETRNKMMAAILALSACACSGNRTAYEYDTPIYPDYTDVTIPWNVAPLNFHYTAQDISKVETICSYKGGKKTFKGKEVVWKEDEWKDILATAAGDTLHFSATVRKGSGTENLSWTIAVSEDRIDPYITYRLIEPGYEVWNQVEIRERNIESFDERAISDWQNTNNSCMNCHVHGQGRADLSIFYVRGANGGAFLNRDGELRKLNLRAKDMISGTVYGELHPSGRYGVFSTNVIIPGFHSMGDNRLEVYDKVSDLAIADFDRNEMIVSPLTSRKDVLETFPVFSADGKSIYYCAADSVKLPEDVEKLRYSLMRIQFDEVTGQWGGKPEVIWDAAEHGGSVCHPKCSPDGKWIMYTVADYGTFPIWHRECRLELMNLETGEILAMDNVQSDRSETYHSWSTSSKWFAFASKRGDGQYGKPYFSHIDADGNTTKPFVLPQKDPWFYEKNLRSFNIPDLADGMVDFDAETVGKMCREVESEPFR